MGVNLSKGQVVNLSKENSGLTEITLGLGWQGKGGRSLDLDSYIALQDNSSKNIEFIYFSNKTCNGVIHHGDDLTGGGSTDHVNEKITIKLNELDSNVTTIIAGLFIYSGASNLSQVDHAFIKLTDQTNNEIVMFDVKQNFGSDKSIIVGEFKKSNDEWKFKAIGSGSTDNYSDIKSKFSRGRTTSTTTTEAPRRGILGRLFGN